MHQDKPQFSPLTIHHTVYKVVESEGNKVVVEELLCILVSLPWESFDGNKSSFILANNNFSSSE